MSDAIELIAGTAPQSLRQAPPLAPFSEPVLGFLAALSAALLGEPAWRAHPGLVALGFWLRPAGLARLRAHADGSGGDGRRRAAGVVLHLAPGNVDNLFAYPWVISLLCGNADVIRLSSRPSDERTALLELIRRLLADDAHATIRARCAIVRYGHDDAVTGELSALADRRVIWGSDATIAHLRALPAPPACQDILFPDRQSAALLSAAALDGAADLDNPVEALYRDAYTFDQRACASPRLLLWLADGDVQAARARFWPAFADCVSRRQPLLGEADLVDKLAAVQSVALEQEVVVEAGHDRRLMRVLLSRPDHAALAGHGGAGLFFEGIASDTRAIGSWLPPRTQTLTHWGFDGAGLDALCAALGEDLPDRLVPLGRALDFDPLWDGMDLFERLSRQVRVMP